jgi:hypothetical protein
MAVLPAIEYLEISPDDRRKAENRGISLLIATALQAYADSSTSQTQRSDLAQALLADLTSPECLWCEQYRIQALKIIKELSRLSGSSERLATTEPIKNLLHLAGTFIEAQRFTSWNEELDLILRVLNNVLFQHSQSRETFGSIGGVKLSLDLISYHSSAVITFLAARLVFFSTLFEAEVTKDAVEQLHLIDVFVKVRGYLAMWLANCNQTNPICDLSSAPNYFFKARLLPK